jgi:hypothetical protein
VFGHKSEKIEVPLGVAHDPGKLVDLKQAQITMIILDAFLLKLGALFRRQLVTFTPPNRVGSAQLMVSQERFATVRAHSIRPSAHFHLQNPEIDPQLQFLMPIKPDYFAHFDRAGLVWPILQDRV